MPWNLLQCDPMEDQATTNSTAESRQKSCNGCVKAKRGCDKLHPECSRCKEKKVPCVYAKRTHSEAFDSGLELDGFPLDPPWGVLGSPSATNFLGAPEPDPIFASHFDIRSVTSPDMPPDLPTFLEGQAASAGKMQLVYGGHVECRDEDSAIARVPNYERMADLCNRYEPWQVYDPNTEVHFLVQALKRYPTSFATEGHTPWLHRYLYKDTMEASMRSCLTISSLYSNMTDSNKASVLKVLYHGPNELKQLRETNTARESLARTQALFLYQIIRVFDGDITLRTLAGKDMSLLGSWLGDLCKIRDNLETPRGIGTRGQQMNPPDSWERWIFVESTRRTIILAYAFIALWKIMCAEDTDDVSLRVWEHAQRWTISKQLWEAPSSFDFFRVWRDKPHHVIDRFELQDFLKVGKGEDVDDFARVFMVAYIGLDETKQWFVDTGSSF